MRACGAALWQTIHHTAVAHGFAVDLHVLLTALMACSQNMRLIRAFIRGVTHCRLLVWYAAVIIKAGVCSRSLKRCSTKQRAQRKAHVDAMQTRLWEWRRRSAMRQSGRPRAAAPPTEPQLPAAKPRRASGSPLPPPPCAGHTARGLLQLQALRHCVNPPHVWARSFLI